MQALFTPINQPDRAAYRRAVDRQAQLTKPPGSLGMLERIAARLAAMQRCDTPHIERVHVSIFAADHGVADEGVSAFPQAVTVEMVRNFAGGGAAVNVLARQLGAAFEVVDVGLRHPVDLPNVIAHRAGNGTENFKLKPAMTGAQLEIAIAAGQTATRRALNAQADVFVGGEMGIANTSSASAIAAALLGVSADQLTGAGTGLDEAQTRHKTAVIEQALQQHSQKLNSPLSVLQHVGGFEIVALTAAYLSAAQQRLPVLVDGFISTVAALAATRINPDCASWFIYGHRSEEKGHKIVLETLAAEPILDLHMRLGEASGALMAVPILQMACRLHNEMATFTQAQITTG